MYHHISVLLPAVLLSLLPTTYSHPVTTPIALPSISPRCDTPAFGTFQIVSFQVFQSASTPVHTASALQFHLNDTWTGIYTECRRFLTSEEEAAGARIYDGNHYEQCDNKLVSWAWNGNTLIVLEGWNCGGFGVAGGNINIPFLCEIMKPYYQFGEGLLCQSPTGLDKGSFTSELGENWSYSYEVDGTGNPLI